MSLIVKPVSRPTADCIWNSFRNSGKRHIVITGKRGSGKTTLLSELFAEKQPGLTSYAVPGKAVYLQDNLSLKTVQIGRFNSDIFGSENRMNAIEDAFDSFGVSSLKCCADGDSSWVTIDEIGYLESQCNDYKKALYELFDKKQVVAVVRKQSLQFIQLILERKDVFVVNLDCPFGNIGCVIMASGFGKRFGGNKLMADFCGAPLISRILDTTEGIFTQRVVVTRYEDIATLCEKRGVRTVLHNLNHRSDTIRLGLMAMQGVERCMFATADQPLLRNKTVEALALASYNDPEEIWRPISDKACGSPVVFPKWSFRELLELDGEKGGSYIINKHPEHLRKLNVEDAHELMDADSKEKLNELIGYYSMYYSNQI